MKINGCTKTLNSWNYKGDFCGLSMNTSCASHVLCQSITFDGRSTNTSNKHLAEVAKAAYAFNMLRVYTTPGMNGIIIYNFSF